MKYIVLILTLIAFNAHADVESIDVGAVSMHVTERTDGKAFNQIHQAFVLNFDNGVKVGYVENSYSNGVLLAQKVIDTGTILKPVVGVGVSKGDYCGNSFKYDGCMPLDIVVQQGEHFAYPLIHLETDSLNMGKFGVKGVITHSAIALSLQVNF